MCPWGQIAAAPSLTNRHPNKLELKTLTPSMWPTCASLDLWKVKETGLVVTGSTAITSRCVVDRSLRHTSDIVLPATQQAHPANR